MSTLDRRQTTALPPLVAGERLDRATFHARYEAMSPGVRAELVGGIVHMPSPLGYSHGAGDEDVSYWLGHYRRATPGVGGAANATTQFDDYGEPQPDHQLRIHEERGGRSRIVGGYVVGPPELVVEVSVSSRAYDLGPKKKDYERAGVQEYLFVGHAPEEVRWFVLHHGRFDELPPGPGDRVYRSDVFPGLWLDSRALFTSDLDGLIATLDRGLATPEHAAFAARLAGSG